MVVASPSAADGVASMPEAPAASAAPPPATMADTAPATPSAPVAPAVPEAKSLPVRTVRALAPAPASGDAPMQALATKLVRKGEQAFAQQDYTAAITNAKAALEARPDDARARHLLQEAQQAQQNAMNNISIQ